MSSAISKRESNPAATATLHHAARPLLGWSRGEAQLGRSLHSALTSSTGQWLAALPTRKAKLYMDEAVQVISMPCEQHAGLDQGGQRCELRSA
jgi:hypothetical protein